MINLRTTILSILLLICSHGFALTPLPVDQAFHLTLERTNADQLIVHWHLSPKHHLYKDRIHIRAVDETTILGHFEFPDPIIMVDFTGKEHQVYQDDLKIIVPLIRAGPNSKIQLSYQGCYGTTYCYPPIHTIYSLDTLEISQKSSIHHVISHSIWQTLLGFFIIGLLLTFTPCVLPMLPILSSILLKQADNISFTRRLIIAAAYVLGIAMMYGGLGSLAGLLGQNLQASLQTPTVLTITAVLFLIMGLSLFDFFVINLPISFSDKMSRWQEQHHSGGVFSSWILGALSILIVSPCVTPPLVAALSYISTTGSVFLGSTALFVAGLGIGTPILLIALLGTQWLPQSGGWMVWVKKFIGLLLWAIAINMLSRFLSNTLTGILFAALAFVAVFLLKTEKSPYLIQIPLLLLSIYLGYLALPKVAEENHQQIVVNQSQFNQALTKAKPPILVDFYAKWCLSCKEMENGLLKAPKIKALLTQFTWIKVDLSDYSPETDALMKKYHIIAPPTFLFLNQQGEEIPGTRLVGMVKKSLLLHHLQDVSDNNPVKPTS